MVEVLNYHEQVMVRTMKTSQLLDYNWFFKQLYNLPQFWNINITHVLVSDRSDGKIMGLRLRVHMDFIEETQNLLKFKKERQYVKY